ncbi:hypothetical protein Syun_029391 [Stephania yunnanensis]|uniref:Uncharacterized protein n=1 Tax=Stephania yunnanensis TaxID=152371 RepID=A0AAP0HJE8_9MAGN
MLPNNDPEYKSPLRSKSSPTLKPAISEDESDACPLVSSFSVYAKISRDLVHPGQENAGSTVSVRPTGADMHNGCRTQFLYRKQKQ